MKLETKGNLTKKIIEKTAIEQFSIHGFQKTSYEMLSEACGVKRANIQYHFAKKEDLFMSCVQRVALDNHAYLAQKIKIDDDAVTKLEIHFKENLKWFLMNRDQAQIILGFYYLATVDLRFHKACQSVLNTGMARIMEYLLLGVRTKHFRIKLDEVEVVAELLHNALVGGILRAVTTTDKKADVTKITKEAMAKWKTLFRSILTESSVK